MSKTTTENTQNTEAKLTKNNSDTENFFRFVHENDLRHEASILLKAAIGKLNSNSSGKGRRKKSQSVLQ